MSGRAVLIDDGILETESGLTPQQFLLAHGDGVYTSALLTPEAAVVDWELHKKRLARGLEVLNERESRPFAPLLAALQSQDTSLQGFVSRHVTPAVKSALGAFYGAAARSPGTASGDGGDGRATGPQPPRPHAMLVIAISPPQPQPQPQPEALPLQPRPCSGSTGTGQQQQERLPRLPVRVAVFCKAVQPPPYGPGHAAQAAVMGRPRALAVAKACSWVAERRRYEVAKPAEAAEVLLSDCEGGILEGLISNFYVVADTTTATAATTTTAAAASPAAPASEEGEGKAASVAGAAGNAFEGLVLQVCGPDSGAALPGVAQCRLLQAAVALGLRTELRPPRAAERGTWWEAFLSNCIKRVQPLRRVFCPPGNDWGFDPWEWEAHAGAHGPGPVTSALREQLLRLEVHTPWQRLE